MEQHRALQVPPLALASLVRWGLYGIKPGGALMCAVENDLIGFCSSADQVVLYSARDLMRYVFWNLPVQCFGSRDVCRNWSAKIRGDRSILQHWDPFDHLEDQLVTKVLSLLGDDAVNDILALTGPETQSRIERLKPPPNSQTQVEPSEC